jgi:hypothetical protein
MKGLWIMGDVSIIARRLSPVYVQHGWSGNGGYFNNVGLRLLSWYDDPKLMDYLFGLGQLSLIGKPGSEKGGERMILTHQTTGTPHWVDPSERWIFSKIAFIDYGYFYDSDNTWYYVIPGPFRVKIPLAYIANHLDDREYEFEECRRIVSRTMDYCLNEFVPTDDELIEIANSYDKPYKEIVNQILGAEHPDHELFDYYRKLYKAMDDWVVVKTDDANENITKIILMKNQGENRKETIDWG